MTIYIKHKNRPQSEQAISENDLAELCLNLCGGGFNPNETAKAMLMQSDLIKNKGGDLERGFYIEIRD
jgi:hypothetical protein